MAQQTMTGQSSRSGTSVPDAGMPQVTARGVGALLALAIAAVHVADQGGVTDFASPGWLGWGYRLIEIGAVLTAVVLLLPLPARLGSAPVGWLAAAALAAGPFVGYLASRTAGLPGDRGDVGNWGDWLGTVSLLVEAALVAMSIGILLARRRPATTATFQP